MNNNQTLDDMSVSELSTSFCVEVKKKNKRTCKREGCCVRPVYNHPGNKQAMYCMKHKLDGMVNVKDKTCEHEGCRVQPHYNHPGNKQALYCVQHKQDGMVDVKSKTCEHEGCIVQPVYNHPGNKKGVYCAKHKLDGMVNVKDKTCEHEGCRVQPHYNHPGNKQAMYCAEHKQDGMVDVINKKCEHEDCRVQPTYNYPGNKKGVYCAKHKLEGMVNVISKTCNSEWCFTIVNNNKYDGYCLFCYMNLFPDKPVSRNYKTKEYSVVEFVKTKFPEFEWTSDKRVSGGCSRRRPDLLMDLGYQIIIVEIDENQHIDYDCSCENKRIMEISQDVGHRPIVFIRFNPDEYTLNGKTITSCWGTDNNGLCVIKKSKKKEWEHRLFTLEEQIQYWAIPINQTTKMVEIIQLFYDEP